MAEIVLGIGSSHGPTMNTPPDRWQELGEKDMQDSRFDFATLIANPRPGIDQELTLEKFTERYNALQRDVDELNGIIQEANPDAVVVLSNPHGGIAADVMQPTFGIHLNDALPQVEGPARPGRAGTTARDGAAGDEPRRAGPQYPTDGELARQIMSGMIEEGFDVAACFQSAPGQGLDGSYNLLYQRYDTEQKIPYVPVLVSRYLPNQATPQRCYEFGQALARVINRWDSPKRVAVMASGGLSHQIIDEDLDRIVIDALTTGNAEAMGSLSRDRLNYAPGTPEILNWVGVAGAMAPKVMTLLDYVPCYRSKAGTGHGCTFGYWK
jgi:3-O-methylgallate 3,4-dioxygenase